MTVEAICPKCKRTYTVDESWVGRRAVCKGCGATITVAVAPVTETPSAVSAPVAEVAPRPPLPPPPPERVAAEHAPPSLPVDAAAEASPAPPVRVFGIPRKWLVASLAAIAGCLLIAVLAALVGVSSRKPPLRSDGSAGPGTAGSPSEDAVGDRKGKRPFRKCEAAALKNLTRRGHPTPVQNAIDLYREGKCDEAAGVLRGYLENAGLHALKKARVQDGKVVAPTSDMPDPEAYYLRGLLQLFHFRDHADSVQDSFEIAISLDGGYRQKAASVLQELCLELMAEGGSEESIKASTLEKIRQHVAHQKLRRAAMAIEGAWGDAEKTRKGAEEIAKLLRKFDREAGSAMSERIRGLAISAARREEIVFATWCQALPELVAALKLRKDADLVLSAAPNGGPGHAPNFSRLEESFPESWVPTRCTAPVFSRKELPNGAKELFTELLRQNLIGVHPGWDVYADEAYRGMTSRSLNWTQEFVSARLPLIDAALRHSEELLPLVLERAKRDSAMAIGLLAQASTVGDARAILGGMSLLQKPASVHLPEVEKLVVEQFCRTVISHAQDGGSSDFVRYCIKAWPPVSPNDMAYALMTYKPELLRGEDFYFALMWTRSHAPCAVLPSWGNADFSDLQFSFASGSKKDLLASYVRRWPQGRYVSLCKADASAAAQPAVKEKIAAPPISAPADSAKMADNALPKGPASPAIPAPQPTPAQQKADKQTVAEKHPVPEEGLQIKAEEQLRERFGDELRVARTTVARTALAKGLLDVAKKSDDPAARYVALRLARDVAVAEGDPVAFCSLIEEMDRHYTIDAMAMKADAISKAWSATDAARYRKSLVQRTMKLLDEAMKTRQFAAADRLVRVALAAARQARDGRATQELQRLSLEIKSALKRDTTEKP